MSRRPLTSDSWSAIDKPSLMEMLASGMFCLNARVSGTVEQAMTKWEQDKLPAYDNEETKRSYRKQLARIRPVFGPCAWEDVTLPYLVEYLDKRSAKTQANRELALLSVIWNQARLWGLTILQWPAAGMARSGWKNKEQAREVDVSDRQFDTIYKHADSTLRDAMDIATATGLRVQDVCALRMSDFRDGALFVQAGKTRKRITFDTTQSDVLPRLLEHRLQHKALHIFLLTSERGKPVTWRMLSERFAKARALAAVDHPECAGLILRDMRKHAAQHAGGLDEASKLLQHSSKALTAKHYGASDVVKTVR